ncbi:MAG: endolytic transglycosylase MltG, partial [bacterium]|nr:endolytic transglycosylase MltG [bacterium]
MAQKTIIYIFGGVLFLGLLNFFLMSPPGRFPVNGVVTIEQGDSVSKVSEILKTRQIIRSEAAFKFFVIITGGEKRIRPGSYTFDKPLPVFIVAWQVSARGFKFSQTTVTIP